MTRAITSGELVLLRTPGDWVRAHLGIYVPNVIYTALLNGAPASTDMVGQITFDGGSGTLANVKAEMTLWVGSSAGARDLGTCRIRKAPSGATIYIGYTSEIDWADNCHLTIVDHAMLSRKPVLIDAGVIKMDGEHAFTDQHIDFDPAPVLTPHAVATLTGATVDVVFDAADSWVFDSTITGYAWSAPGASASSGMATSTATITYNAAGYYRVECVVTAANGKTATGVRFVMVFDSTHKPHEVEVQAPQADYDAGGWSFAVKMHSDADPVNVIEGALAILYGEDRYGSTEQAIGQVANRENIICWGYIAGESIEWDAEISSVEFEVQGPQFALKDIEVNPLALSFATNTPDAWGVMPALTVDRALWHVLHWRSNATALLSVTLTGDARYAPRLESMDGSLWSQMEEVAFSKIFGRIGCDRYGRFFAVVDPQCVPEADRTWATVMTITKKDWQERINISRTTQRKLAMLSISGWLTDAGGSTSTLYSLSMGHIHAQTGGVEIIDQLLAESQTQFNELAGLYLGWKNNELEFDFRLAQNNRMVDLWPNQFLDVSMIAGDTPRGIAYAGNLIPRSITLQPDPETGAWSTEISCEAETFAELAVNGDVPASTGVSDWDTSFPPDFDLPDIPDIPWIELPPTTENLNHPKEVVIASNKGVLYTLDFDAASPTWQFMNNGLPVIDRTDIYNLVRTPSGALYLHINSGNYVYRSSGLGGAWVLIASAADFSNEPIQGIGVNPLASDTIGILGGTSNPGKFKIATGGVLGTATGVNGGRLKSGVCFSGNHWFLATTKHGIFSGAYMVVLSAGGSVVANYDIYGNAYYTRRCGSIGSSGVVWAWSDASDKISVCSTSALTGDKVFYPGATGITVAQALAMSPAGTHAMGCSSALFTPYKTTDSGGTWSSVAGTVPSGSDVWENCLDNNRWIFGGGTTIRVTTDQGATYSDKMGNLGYIAALIDITHIRYIK